jgi:hypothetical protein
VIKLIGTKLKGGSGLCYIAFYFGCFMNWYSKLIGSIIEGRKCAAARGDQAFLVAIPL